MLDLIDEYKVSLKKVRVSKATASEEDSKLLGSMESDLRYCIQWMTTARRPGNRRGIERLAAYQREKPFDPILVQQYFYSLERDERLSREFDPYQMIDDVHHCIRDSDRERIDEALSCLTRLERDVYLMARGRGIPRAEIAMIIGVEKGTVNKMLLRADKKIKVRVGLKEDCLPNAT